MKSLSAWLFPVAIVIAFSLPAQAGVRPEFTLSAGAASHESHARRYFLGYGLFEPEYAELENVAKKAVSWSADAGAMLHPNWSLGMRVQHSEYTTDGIYASDPVSEDVFVRSAAVSDWYLAPRVAGYTPAIKLGPETSKLRIRAFAQAGIGARYALWQEQTYLVDDEFNAVSAYGYWSFAGHLGGGLLFGGESGVGMVVSGQIGMATDSPEPAATDSPGGRSWWSVEAGLRFSPPAVE